MPQINRPGGPAAPYTPMGGDARTGQMAIRPFTPPSQTRRPAYTSSQIQDYVLGQGWANEGGVTNPRAIYDEAQNRGISAAQLDQAGAPLGWQPGTVSNYIQQQGWDPLRNRSGDARTGQMGFLQPGPMNRPRSSAVPNDPRVGGVGQNRETDSLVNALVGRRMRIGG